jgi:hypothetical protein
MSLGDEVADEIADIGFGLEPDEVDDDGAAR